MSVGFVSPYAKLQFFDDNGAVLSAGLLYSYLAGTTTPQSTYSNADLDPTHVNTNPLVLDAAGRGLAYLAPVSYKLVLKTALGVTLWTVDNIQGNLLAGSVAVLSKVANYTVAVGDGTDVMLLADTSGGPFTVGIYTAVGHAGNRLLVKKTSTSVDAVTLDPSGSETIDGQTTWALIGVNAWIQIESDGTSWQVIGRGGINVGAKTALYTLTYADDLIQVTSGTFTITFPTAVGCRGKTWNVKNSGTGVVTLDGNGAETIDGVATVALAQYDSGTLMSDGANLMII